MKVWIDVFSGDEMVSDSYPYQLLYGDAALEVKAKYMTKGSDFVAIAGKLNFIMARYILFLKLFYF
jgi:hypothetical protein